MYETRYFKAQSIDEARARLETVDNAKVLAGGMTLIPTLKQRLAQTDMLIDLAHTNLSFIEDTGTHLKIGAMSRHRDVETSELVIEMIPALAALAGGIGDRQVRNCGTIGGSIANNDPSACYPAALIGLGATIHTSTRDIPADTFFVGMFETDLAETEIITAVSFPKPEKAAYVKFPNPASRYAMVGVFVAVTGQDVCVAITGAGEDGVFRHKGMEAALKTTFSANAVEDVRTDEDMLLSDIHAGSDYRAHLVREMTRRAVLACN